MPPLKYSPRALEDLTAIRAYISEQGSPMAAERYIARLLQAIVHLETAPMIGRRVRGSLRELATVRPYLIRYAVSADLVEVLRIRHAARRPSA